MNNPMRLFRKFSILLTILAGPALLGYAFYVVFSIVTGPYSGGLNRVNPNGVSPDGRFMVVTHVKPNRRDETYILNVETGNSWYMVETGNSWYMNEGEDWQFSSDSQQIVFVEDRRHIAIADADGGNRRRLASCGRSCRSPRWSDDQQQIVYGSDDGCCAVWYEQQVVGINGNAAQDILANVSVDERPLADVSGFYAIEPRQNSDTRTNGFAILNPNTGKVIRTVTYRSIYRFQFVAGLQLTIPEALLVAIMAIVGGVYLLWEYSRWRDNQAAEDPMVEWLIDSPSV